MSNKFYSPFLIVFASLLFNACGENSQLNEALPTGEWAGYEFLAIRGTDIQRVGKKNEFGQATEEGFVLNGSKTGVWLTFHPEGRIKTIDNYINGSIEGASIELDKRGQMIHKAFYYEGELHGLETTYKFGRAQESIPYNHGVIDGTVVRYYNNGKIMEQIDFKGGLQHGYYHHYNTNEKLDMKYEYENGEKISGGMVDPNRFDSLNVTK